MEQIFSPIILIAILSVLLSLVQYGIYIKDTLSGKTKPHAFSWFVWALPTVIVCVAQFIQGGGAGSWATASSAFLCTVIFILALKYGEKHFTVLDWLGLCTSVVALVWWWFTNDPTLSVTLVTLADIVGFIPTIRKTLTDPTGETLSTYWIGGAKWIFSIFSLSAFSYVILVYPIAMIVANWGYALFTTFLQNSRNR